MTGILKVDTIQDSSGGNEIKPSGLAPEIDMYRLTSNFSSNATITAWERVDDATFTKIGTGMSVSSGIFTFPKTGVYKITLFAGIQNVSGDTSTTVNGEISSDTGSNFDETIFLIQSDSDSSAFAQSTSNGVGIFNVTSTTTFQFRVVMGSVTGASTVLGNTDKTRTGVLFERIADAQ